VRPDRDYIAAPDLPETLAWVNPASVPPSAPQGGKEGGPSMPQLTAGGPALVHFFDYAQVNSVRTLPYVSEWARRYAGHGLRTIGVQAPRFPFGAKQETVATGVERLGIDFPVAIDAEHELWHDYGCTGWPSLFLWKQGGALAWFHFGEGEYRGTEEAIQAELRESDALRELPRPMNPLRPTDAPGAKVVPPTPEVFPGGSWERPWTAGEDGERLELPYGAGGAYATVEGRGEIAVDLDGSAVDRVEVTGPALYALAEHERHENHTIAVQPSPGLRVWSIGFAAGVP
jgi:hypothetical protein